MQAVESETLILYQTDMRGQWPEDSARALAARLPYARRLAASSGSAAARASLAGVALALRALGRVLGRRVAAGEIVMAAGEKPRLAAPVTTAAAPPAQGDSPDFSISHSGPWVGCAALAHGRIGLDIEMGSDARIADWVVREALLKATGAGLRAAAEARGIELHDAAVRWQGELWHVRRLDQFPGACACVLSSRALTVVDAHVVQLTELFAS
jgi:phosphopantetheinyl transferase